MQANEFIQLEQQAKEDLAVPDNIDAAMNWQMFDLPNIQYEWAKKWAKQKYVVEVLKDEVKEIYGKLMAHFKYGAPHPNPANNTKANKMLWSTTKEIEYAIDCEPTYCAKIKELRQQQYFLDAIEDYYKNICRLDYKTHDYLDYFKTKTKSF